MLFTCIEMYKNCGQIGYGTIFIIVVVPERWLKDDMMHRSMKDLIVSHLIMMEYNIMENLTTVAGNHYDDIYDEVKMMQSS